MHDYPRVLSLAHAHTHTPSPPPTLLTASSSSSGTGGRLYRSNPSTLLPLPLALVPPGPAFDAYSKQKRDAERRAGGGVGGVIRLSDIHQHDQTTRQGEGDKTEPGDDASLIPPPLPSPEAELDRD